MNEIVSENDDLDALSLKPLSRSELDILCTFFQAWQQRYDCPASYDCVQSNVICCVDVFDVSCVCHSPIRHCGCVFKDLKNVDRLNSLVRGLLITSVNLLKHVIRTLNGDGVTPAAANNVVSSKYDCAGPSSGKGKEPRRSKMREEKVVVDENVDSDYSENSEEEVSSDDDEEADDVGNNMDDDEDVTRWPQEEKEKLFHLVSKVFYVHFPLYAVHKNALHATRLDDLSQREAALLSSYCDLNDPEVPIMLLRNISFYCELDVLDHFVALFSKAKSTDALPLSFAHAVVAVIHHLKYGLNVNNMLAKLVSLRTCVINYLCNVSSSRLIVIRSDHNINYHCYFLC